MAAIGVAAALVVTTALLIVTRIRTDHPDDASSGTTRDSGWQRVMAGLTESGESTVTVARQAFSLTFEQLPGVDVPSGSRDDIQSGSAALQMMIAHWDELTTAEQSIVLNYLPSDDPTVTESGDSIVPATEGALGPPSAPGAPGAKMVGFAARTGPRSVAGRAPSEAAGPDEATKQRIESRVAALRTSLGALAGGFLTGVVEVSYNTHDVVVGSAAYTLAHAPGQLVTHPTPTTATLSGTSGAYSGCFLAFNPFGWQTTGANLDFIIAHELYHCFEAMFIGDLDLYYDKATAPPWVIEGGANWAAAQVVPTSSYPAPFWQRYLLIPSTPLFQQTYDAIGFWNHLREVSPIDTWTELRSALGRSSADALAQTDAGSDAFLDSSASSLFRKPQFGPSWQTDGPTMSALRFTPEEVTITAGTRLSRSALPLAKALLAASITTDIVVIVSVGHVTMHNAAHDEANFGQLVYCVRDEGCECPPGSVNTAASPAALGGRDLAFGITGNDRAAAVALGGISLDEWCRKARPPISKRPGASGANSSGNTAGGGDSLCHQIVERLGVDGFLNNPTMSPADIQACVTEILASGGFASGP